eukprot:NODE_45_length_32908_cov_0.790271.p19 type:complete len:231 gc:universal NODE_45_length_32908_cov_0.790271:13724-13032(-)
MIYLTLLFSLPFFGTSVGLPKLVTTLANSRQQVADNPESGSPARPAEVISEKPILHREEIMQLKKKVLDYYQSKYIRQKLNALIMDGEEWDRHETDISKFLVKIFKGKEEHLRDIEEENYQKVIEYFNDPYHTFDQAKFEQDNEKLAEIEMQPTDEQKQRLNKFSNEEGLARTGEFQIQHLGGQEKDIQLNDLRQAENIAAFEAFPTLSMETGGGHHPQTLNHFERRLAP